MTSEYEPVIGLEIHAQLLTRSKMFCACPASYGAAPNTLVCPVCLGLPGALPVANETAVEFAVTMGLATDCTIARRSVFARKNYFYPDCPKNYQITQYDAPLCTGGHIRIDGNDKKIRIKRIHLEEDAGKLVHSDEENSSYVDMNRVGIPLIEIVTEPDLRSPAEASLFMQKLRAILRYLEICDGNMEEGSLRCDVNVSLRKTGTGKHGVNTEIKNLNSFKAIEQALDYEVERQKALLGQGLAVSHATLLWDDAAGECRVMRSKEEAHDYRYFPEPDLRVLEVSDTLIERARASLPELPAAKEKRFVGDFGIPAYDAQLLTATKEISDYYEIVARESGNPKAASNWVMGEVLRELNERKIEIPMFEITPERLARLIREVEKGTINIPTAKSVFKEMAKTGHDPEVIIAGKGLEQIGDEAELDEIIGKVLDNHPSEVAMYLAGKVTLLKFLVGQVMKASKGKAHPQKTTDRLKTLLEERRDD
ncbi:MAG: Asp-tRNA(Asn)/Glu-tRNA(Gln) amidotransferase subunit GatB [Candidatus Latescibacterota bacterium]|nr:MAG: Asp-tRNA(Asn)/Glu-tRNA(Gln) amidotransferase subunit GatB [Candidatus Latescibacterota bacterium]